MWIAAAIGALIVGYIIWNRLKRMKHKPVLDLCIATVDGYYYTVDVRKKKPIVEPKEKIVLALGLAANILASLHKAKHPEKQHILKFLSAVTAGNLTQTTINKYFRREFAFEISASLGTINRKGIQITLLKDAEGDLNVAYKEPFSLFKYQFLFSLASFIVMILENLDIQEHETLRKSLAYISSQYLNVSETPFAGSAIEMLNNAYAAGKAPDHLRDVETG